MPAVSTIGRALNPAGPSSGIKGTVTAVATAPTGPVAGATVRVWLKDAGTHAVTVSTNAQGRYTLPSLPAGTYQVDVVRRAQRHWAPGTASRTGAATATITPACTTSPDPTFGDLCATPIDVTMP